MLLGNLGATYVTRYGRLSEVSDINNAVMFLAQAISLTPDDHAVMPLQLNNLSSAYITRFKDLGQLADIDDAIKCLNRAISTMPDSHPHRSLFLNNLGASHGSRYDRLEELPDLEKCIASWVQSVLLTLDDDPEKLARLLNLCGAHIARFQRLSAPQDIDEAIACAAHAGSIIPVGHVRKAYQLWRLGISHRLKYQHQGEISDLAASLVSLQEAALSLVGPPSVRFRAACDWARLCLSGKMLESVLGAYHLVMQLLPQVVWLGSSVTRRYEEVSTLGAVVYEAATTAVVLKDFNLSLEWLEEGRSIVWKQILQLRTPFDDLRVVDPALSSQLEQVSQSLEGAYAIANDDTKIQPDSRGIGIEQAAQSRHQLVQQ